MTGPAELAEERKHKGKDREDDELRRIPVTEIDKSKWPADVRGISIEETGGLGIDRNGRLHWNGKPIEIIAQHLDLTRLQTVTAAAIAVCTLITAVATSVQAWTAYHEWACKAHWAVYARCPEEDAILPRSRTGDASKSTSSLTAARSDY
jgi:hypothetical protein